VDFQAMFWANPKTFAVFDGCGFTANNWTITFVS
jgi:hypothetical protein